jgi:hypothetical protein
VQALDSLSVSLRIRRSARKGGGALLRRALRGGRALLQRADVRLQGAAARRQTGELQLHLSRRPRRRRGLQRAPPS